MYLEGKERAKIGKVTVDITADRYRLRFTYPKGKRHQLKIAQVSDEGWAVALKAAQLVNRDIDLGDFDETYARYSPTHAKTLELAQEKKTKTYTLVEVWERYKDLNKDRIAQTTQNHLWKDCDRYLSRTDKRLLELNKAQEFVSYLQSKYAVSTIATLFRSCINPAVNAAVNAGLITVNPYQSINIPKPQKKPIECFEPNEVKAIIAAFYSDEYKHKFSSYEHSFYAQYVEMLALTGARPEEIVALTFDDIKRKGGKTYIKFSKAYSKGILLPHTKTKEIRLFPCNKQLVSVLDSVPRTNKLMFPGVEGGYLNHGNFRKRDWRVVLKGLVEEKRVEKYLKPYALRHSFITRLVRDGVDIKTVATLSGNSVATIIKHYLAAKQDFNLPEL
ncbi:tyrosine-type recombinase/integrase [Pleurocapsa sp. PCC 7319]|uniref:tyrosine-type recombinase/integrase n=1 Tax=Pleurocapsa sp. PCC 7319 TaxID=118161 RepID=UPI0003449C75|nr:tyrosine-type recombinase/integrase [Pleurocapsa sp. PCC 7319]